MFKKLFVAVLAMFASASAFALPVDLSGITGAVDFSTVTAAVLAIAGLLAAVYVAIKGARIALNMLRGN